MKDKNPIYDFLKDAKGVIHIGASTGQERFLYADLNLPVLWIEAIPESYELLKENIKLYGNQRALNYLITDKNEPNLVPFVITNNSWSSSIFDLKKHKEIWPEVEAVDTLYLHQYTLPSALLSEGIDISLYDTLILDVQGAELLVLQGAKDILKHFKYIRCEASDAELYEGQCLAHQLNEWLRQHGFKDIQAWKTAESTPEIGIYEILYQSEITTKNCEITDDQTGNKQRVKVGVVCSEPRLGFGVHASVTFQAFGARGWPVARVSGAFWEQSMQNGLNNLIALGCDYIITKDYDSIFSGEDINELLLMAVRYPEADALTSWQIGRREGQPDVLLGWQKDGQWTKDIDFEKIKKEEITEVDHCVFGLTLIKTEALLKMQKPWFQSLPNADGEWMDGKIDADSYFWMKWKEAGNSIFVVNSVKIGHLEEVILWVEDDFKASRQPLSMYHKIGRPF